MININHIQNVRNFLQPYRTYLGLRNLADRIQSIVRQAVDGRLAKVKGAEHHASRRSIREMRPGYQLAAP